MRVECSSSSSTGMQEDGVCLAGCPRVIRCGAPADHGHGLRQPSEIRNVDSGTLPAEMDKPKILTAKELRAIMPRLSGWSLARNKLSRTFEFQDFVQSLSFVNSLVEYFDTIDHHPDAAR